MVRLLDKDSAVVVRMDVQQIELKEVHLEPENEDESPGCFTKLWNQIRPEVLCPSNSKFLTGALAVAATLITFGALVSLLGPPALPPDGGIFHLTFLVLVAYLSGCLVSLCKLPPLLGMLIAGIVLKNIGFFILEEGYRDAVVNLRKLAMVVILIKAGLGLDAKALKQLSCVVLRLAFCPCLVEAATAMLAARYLLHMPWLWGILLGCVLAAVSPAVVVPSLLSLKERGFGEDKGISTLVIAASSLDDIAAISLFGIFLGMIFSDKSASVTMEIMQGPIEVTLGILFGVCYGLLMIYLPHKKDVNIALWRAIMLMTGGILAVLGSEKIGFGGAGPLGLIIAAFVASCGWRTDSVEDRATALVTHTFSSAWTIFQPILFGLIGTEITLSELHVDTVLLGLAVLFCGLTLRIIAVWIITYGGVLNVKERLFVIIAWFPKATVQALLGPIALDLARETGASDEIILLGEQVLTISVLSILVTAPIGAIGIKLAGPRLLNCVKEGRE